MLYIMKNKSKSIIQIMMACSIVFAALFTFHVQAQQPAPVKNIVLVHGAFVDGSGWKPVYDILVGKGYHVSIVQQPLTSFDADLAAVKRVLDLQDGLCILVGHSYGGGLITEAGNDPHVAGLVYIAAHAPDKGESEADNGKRIPPAYKSLQKPANGFDYIDPAQFPADFAGDPRRYDPSSPRPPQRRRHALQSRAGPGAVRHA